MSAMTGSAYAKERVAAVAFCADQFMEVPLHVAASSLLRNLHPDYTAHFYFLLTGFSEDAIRTLDGTGRNYTFVLLETSDVTQFQGFHSLHGSYAIYYRLLLPDLVNEDRLLYLDSDIQIKVDVSPLFTIDIGSKAVGFVVDGTVSSGLDAKFLLSLGKSLDGPGFNSGVMLLNLPEWRRQECSLRIFAFCRQYGAQLINNDQTALNAVFADECYRLDPQYNVKLYPNRDRERCRMMPNDGIFHFIGSPKPWDIGGRLLLPHAGLWFDDLRKTAIPIYKRIPWLNRVSWLRLPKILGGYRLIAKQKLFKR
jgi:lipopolysaccharide biosynthesis glycosyltransferase